MFPSANAEAAFFPSHHHRLPAVVTISDVCVHPPNWIHLRVVSRTYLGCPSSRTANNPRRQSPNCPTFMITLSLRVPIQCALESNWCRSLSDKHSETQGALLSQPLQLGSCGRTDFIPTRWVTRAASSLRLGYTSSHSKTKRDRGKLNSTPSPLTFYRKRASPHKIRYEKREIRRIYTWVSSGQWHGRSQSDSHVSFVNRIPPRLHSRPASMHHFSCLPL